MQALRRPHNWIQLAKFGAVGASGYVVNLAVYALLLKQAHLHYLLAATDRFSSQRPTTTCGIGFGRSGHQRGHVAYQV